MYKTLSKRRRTFIFIRLFVGISYDFWRESRLVRRLGSSEAQKRSEPRHRRRAIQFREYALMLGGVLIKLGQFLSARADVMPEVYLNELSKLQDTVPPVSYVKIKSQLEVEFGKPIEEIFTDFNVEPRASASLAQVHIATTQEGEEVAVKVLRPGIEKQINTDLAILSYIMEGVNNFTKFGKRFNVMALVEEFARTLGDELDFIREGFNAERMRENFKDSQIIYIPYVYWEYTRDKVLTLEKIEGIKINNYQELERNNISRQKVAEELIQCYLKQILTDGFFHADPHPGNLFVVEGPRITFVDFGMVGEITPEMRHYFKLCVLAVARKDVSQLIEALQKLGFIRQSVNLQPINNAIKWVFQNYEGLSIKNITYESLEQIQEDIRRIVYEQPFNLPAEFGFLGRAVGTLVGLTTGLYPDINFVEASQPIIDKLKEAQKKEWKNIVIEEAKNIGKILYQLPYQIIDLMEKIENNQLTIKVSPHDQDYITGRKWQQGFALASSIFCSTLAILGVYLFIQDYIWLGIIVFIVSILIFIRSVVSLRRRTRR